MGRKPAYAEIERSIKELREKVFQLKRVEEALRESEERFRELAENIREVFWLFDWNEQKVIYVSPAYETIWGRSIKELYNRYEDWAESIYPDDLNSAQESFAKIAETGGGETREYRIVRPDGSVRWVSDRGFAITGEDGQILRIAGIAEDITQRKRAEEALRESEEKYWLLVENAYDAIFVVQDGVFKYANPRTLEMTGYSLKELASIPFSSRIHSEDRDMVVERYKRRLKGEEVNTNYTYRAISKAGEQVWRQINSVLITWESRPATMCFVRDITSEKRLEAELEQARRMEALGTLAGGIAHDFNNLLMGIQGRISLMIMDADPSQSQYEDLKDMEDIVKSGTDLTKQLLGFARTGKYDVKPTDLTELIKRTFLIFGRTHKEVRIHINYQDDIWAVEVDQRQIEQVLLNLYVNAWQAMPGGGELYLQTRNVILDENFVKPYHLAPGKFVKISVTDTGVGMDETTQQRIFEPFFTTKEMGRGTGLGLASVYGIVRNHGGIINVYSEKGQGANFNIYLPASEGEIIEEKKSPGNLMKGTETILLVDDDERIVAIGEKALKKMGYQVLSARNGREAIMLYEKNQGNIDVVVLDMIMPEMGGGETYERLKAINPNVKVILSSGYSIEGQASEILKRGCDGFIQKPFKMRELSQKIKEILGKNNR
ncbi:MAG: PAS domain S-box protein [Desulfobacteraceae bacterium]|nr:MAG: PAS domain S-box protein [Desulfobacteraceae bacterium]